MSFDLFEREDVGEVVTAFAALENDQFVMFAGAGISVEAGLPTWPKLARELLERAAEAERLFEPDAPELEEGPADGPDVRELRQQWVETTLQTESTMGAIAIADALSSGGAQEHLAAALYGEPPATVAPGPIAMAIAALKCHLGRQTNVYTTNYDLLLEEALRRQLADDTIVVVPYEGDDSGLPPNHLKIRHMHGTVTEAGELSPKLVLTDSQYARMPDSGYPNAHFLTHVEERATLIVGASLNDPNITRLLYKQQSNARNSSERKLPHYVIFVRQAEAYEQPPEIAAQRERSVAERWKRVGVRTVFVDHFVDVANILHEIVYARTKPEALKYESLAVRVPRAIAYLTESVLRPESETSFRHAQGDLIPVIEEAMAAGRAAAIESGYDLPDDETLTAALWLFEQSGTMLRLWVSTERAHFYPERLPTLDLNLHSRWVAVQVACRGASMSETRNPAESRWACIRGIPLNLDTPDMGHLPIGVLTVTTHVRADSSFSQLRGAGAALFDEAIVRTLRRCIQRRTDRPDWLATDESEQAETEV